MLKTAKRLVIVAVIVAATTATADQGSSTLIDQPMTTVSGSGGVAPPIDCNDAPDADACLLTGWQGVAGEPGSAAGTDPLGVGVRTGACDPADGTCAAAALNLFGGQDTTTIAIDGADPSATCTSNPTVTVTRYTLAGGDQGDDDLVEGTDWDATASVENTCISLAAAVDALSGISASCTSPNVLITLGDSMGQVRLAEDTAACTTVSIGTPGVLLVGGGTSTTLPRIALAEDPTTGISMNASRIGFATSGQENGYFNVGALNMPASQIVRFRSTQSTWGSLSFEGLGGIRAPYEGAYSFGEDENLASNPETTIRVHAQGMWDLSDQIDEDGGFGRSHLQTLTVTCDGSASNDTGGSIAAIPDGAALKGVGTKVTTELSGGGVTGYTVGEAALGADVFGTASAVTVGTSTANADATATFPAASTSADREIRITYAGGSPTAGVIEVYAWYETLVVD